jgi:transketolase
MLNNIVRGGYILFDSKDVAAIIIASGSEVELAMNAAKKLTEQGIKIRIVSMPCTDVFDKQDAAYKEAVLPEKVTVRLAIEAGKSDTWYKYVGIKGQIIGVDGFGASAPAKEVFAEFGFTEQNVIRIIMNLIKNEEKSK